MIKLIRIDDRLIHGQVAYAWTRYLDANCILVANDQIPNDDFKKMSLNLAKPPGVDLLIKSVFQAIDYLKSDLSSKKKIFVLVDCSNDALEIAKGLSDVKSINVGGIRMSDGKKMISNSVAVDESDISNFKELISLEVELEIRQVPSEKKKLIKNLI